MFKGVLFRFIIITHNKDNVSDETILHIDISKDPLHSIESEASNCVQCQASFINFISTSAKRNLFCEQTPTERCKIYNPRCLGNVRMENLETPRRRNYYWQSAIGTMKKQRQEMKVSDQYECCTISPKKEETIQMIKDLLMNMSSDAVQE